MALFVRTTLETRFNLKIEERKIQSNNEQFRTGVVKLIQSPLTNSGAPGAPFANLATY
jgi:hypothetical protein